MEEMKPKLIQLLSDGWSIYVQLPPHDTLLRQGSQRLVYSKEIDDVIFQYSVNYKGDVIKSSFLLNTDPKVFEHFIYREYSKLLFTHIVN